MVLHRKIQLHIASGLHCVHLAAWFIALAAATAFAEYRLVHIAGTGQPGFGGDGGLAIAAQVNGPRALAVGPNGALYVADTGNHRVRRIADRRISTIAGNGQQGSSGDGGLATAAQLDTPTDVAVGADGSVYIVTAAGLRRLDAGSGLITTLFGFPSWLYAVTNDAAGNVFIAMTPFANEGPYGPPPRLYLITIPVAVDYTPSFIPIPTPSGARVFEVAAADMGRLVFAFDTEVGYGISTDVGRTLLLDNEELYSLGRPQGVAIDPRRTVYTISRPHYAGGKRYVLRRYATALASIAGGGPDPVRDGGLASTTTLDARALTVAADGTLYVVHAGHQVYALRRATTLRGAIIATVRGGSPLVSVFAAGDDGSLHYAQIGRNAQARFRDLVDGTYRVYAQFDEEGVSCNAKNCGWSGAPNDCPASLNDPLVTIAHEQRVQRVELRLLNSFPCL